MIYRLGTLCLVLLLAACQTAPPRTAPPTTAEGDPRQLSHWSVEGKIGLRLPEQAESAYLNWQQQCNDYQIRLSGPLGFGTVRLIGSPSGVTLESSDQPPHHSDSAEALLFETTGWQLPVSHLKDWARGLPSPQEPHSPLPNGDGFQQADWRVELLRWSSQTPYQLPTKVRLTHQSLVVTLIFKRWQISTPASCSSTHNHTHN